MTVSVSTPRLAPTASGSSRAGYSSEVLLFEDGEPARAVWTSSQELVFALEPDGDGSGVLAATGPNGKLYRVAIGRSSLERTFDEKQVTAIAGDAVGTNSATGLYRMAGGAREGEWVSAVKDTGRTSRFGAFRWEGDAPSGTTRRVRVPLGGVVGSGHHLERVDRIFRTPARGPQSGAGRPLPADQGADGLRRRGAARHPADRGRLPEPQRRARSSIR